MPAVSPAELKLRVRSQSLGDYDDLLGLLSPVALRDLELDALPLFEAAVTVGLDRRKVDENVLATVDGDKAVALVWVEPLDGALSHSKQLPNCCSGFEPRPFNRGTRRSRPAESCHARSRVCTCLAGNDRN